MPESASPPPGTARRVETFDKRFVSNATFFEPRDVAELQALVLKAHGEHKTLKVIGAGHSFSNIAMTNDYIVGLDHLNHIEEPVQDGGQWTVKAGAGMRMKQLNPELWRRGFALANMGEIAEQSIAGAMQTATHGSGLGGNTASSVVEMTLLTADGSLMHLPGDDPELFRAAKVGLGALGIIVDVRIKVQPKFYLEETITVRPFDEVVYSVPGLHESEARPRFRWMPHTNDCQISILRETDKRPKEEIVEPPRAAASYEVFFMNLLTGIGKAIPGFVPISNRMLGIGYLYRTGSFVDISYRRFANGVGQLLKPHEEIEYAVPVADGPRALAATRKLIEDNHLLVNFPVELRFCPADDCSMSPSYRREMAYVGANSIQGRDANKYFRLFAEMMMRDFGGLPHLGKDLVGVTPEYLEKSYGEGYAEFKRMLDKYDPDGVFANDFVRRMFPRSV